MTKEECEQLLSKVEFPLAALESLQRVGMMGGMGMTCNMVGAPEVPEAREAFDQLKKELTKSAE
jgi:hypothetical protein